MVRRQFVAERMAQVPPSGIREIFELAQKYDNLVRLEIGEPDFDTPDYIKEAAKKALDEGLTHYTSSAGTIELRQAVADKLQRENKIDADPVKEVMITSGGCNAISLAINATIDERDEVVVPDPFWPQYEGILKVAGAVPVFFPLKEENQYRIDIDDLESRITSKTKMIIINSPNNPTGSVLSKEDLQAIAELAKRHDVLVLSDEAYEKMTYGETKHYSIGAFPGMEELTISAFTFSKTYAMTGWRLGYASAPATIISQMTKVALFQTSCPSSIAQEAGVAALTGPQDHVAKMVEAYERRRDFLLEGLKGIEGVKCQKPAGSFYAFPNISSLSKSSYDFAKFLIKKAGVSTTPGKAFGNQGEGHIRISYANSMENIEEALRRIKRAVDMITQESNR